MSPDFLGQLMMACWHLSLKDFNYFKQTQKIKRAKQRLKKVKRIDMFWLDLALYIFLLGWDKFSEAPHHNFTAATLKICKTKIHLPLRWGEAGIRTVWCPGQAVVTTMVLRCAGRNYDWGLGGQTGKLIKQCYQHQILALQSQLRVKPGYT